MIYFYKNSIFSTVIFKFQLHVIKIALQVLIIDARVVLKTDLSQRIERVEDYVRNRVDFIAVEHNCS